MQKMPCEVYSRVVGYFRPVDQWNKGKQEEFRQEKNVIFLRVLSHRRHLNEMVLKADV